MMIDNQKYDEFVRKRQQDDIIYQIYREKQIPVHYLNSGKFGLFLKFQKQIFNLYRQIQINSPSANRIFLYLIEVCLGYDEDPKSETQLNIRRLIKECNIKNRKSLYDGIKYLQERNLIFVLEKDIGKVIKLNPSILSWDVEEDRKLRVYKREVDRLTNPSD